jgi:biotin operon repressor
MISSQTKKATAAFAGAVVLASGAYAVGSTSGDGSATANQTGQAGQAAPPGPYGAQGHGPPRQLRREFRKDRMEVFSGLAKQLGVKEADLRKAMQEIRKEQRDDFVKKLADKLGVSEAKVKKALPDRPKMSRRFHGPPPGAAPGAPPAGPPPAAPPGPYGP